MSFNKLPEELVALVASHVDLNEIPQLLQSQQRISKIMKKYKEDKPAIEQMEFIFRIDKPATYVSRSRISITCQVKKTKHSPTRELFRKTYNHENWNVVLDSFSKVRSVNLVIIRGDGLKVTLTEQTAQLFYHHSTLIRKITLDTVKIKLSARSFLRFCNKFTSVGLRKFTSYEQIEWNDILCEVLSITEVHAFYPDSLLNSPPLISNKTLKEAILKNKFCNFAFPCGSSLNVIEIRSLLESIIEKKALFKMGFGRLPIVQPNEELNDWLNYVEQNPDLPYQLQRCENSSFRYKVTCGDSCANFFA